MKKIISFALVFAMLISSVSALAYEVTFFKLVDNDSLLLPETELVVDSGNCIFEAEDLMLGDDVTVIRDEKASGGMAVTTSGVSYQANHTLIKDNTIEFTIKIPKLEHGEYKLWMLYKYESDQYSGFNIFKRFTGYANYEDTRLPRCEDGNYRWAIPGWYTPKGIDNETFTFEIKYKDTGWKIDKFVFTMDTRFSPNQVDVRSGQQYSEPSWISGFDPGFSYEEPPVYPPKGVHPRILATKEMIPQLKENAQHPTLKPMYDTVIKYAKETVNARMDTSKYNNMNIQVLFRIHSRAYAYMMGEVDKANARQAVRYMRDMFETLKWDPGTGDITRQIGLVISTAGMVYDWCYDVLTEEDKKILIRNIKYYASMMEIGYPTTTYESFQGHGGEGDVLFHQLVAAIAIYDEDPEMYKWVAGMLFEVSYPTRRLFNDAGNHPAGTYYGATRATWEQSSAVIFERMGVDPELVMGTNVDKISMGFLYRRLPNGMLIKDGDSYGTWEQSMGPAYQVSDYPSMLYAQVFNNNQYTRAEYIKQLGITRGYQPGIELVNNGIQTLLLLEPESGTAYPHTEGAELPLTLTTKWPTTSVVARTSWKNAIDSDTAVVFMNGQEKITGDHDHDHNDIGHFSIYYKGTLTDQGGCYSWDNHHHNYGRRTVSHNCMTVFDPDEVIANDRGTTYANDGGQKWEHNSNFLHEYLAHEDEAKTVGAYNGPDALAPEFSYLKSDITNAYSDKVTGYTRSMVSINLFNDDYPLAFVCYDNISSSNASFKKTFNLQSYKEPVSIENGQTVITRDDYDFSGKLVVNTMLPKNAKIEAIGGPGKESWVNGKNYPTTTNQTVQNFEESQYRVEISPSVEAKDDLFLNAMYVTDTDKNLPELPMIEEDMAKHVGVTVMDKTVLFSKTRQALDTSFTIDVRNNGYDMMSVFVTDVTEGKWKITGAGTEVIAECKEGENAIYARLAPGTYTVSKASADSAATAFEYNVNYDGFKIGDFLMYDTGKRLYRNNVQKTRIKDGVPFLSADDFEYHGATVTNVNGNITLQRERYISTLTVGSTAATFRGEAVTLTAAPYVDENGILYICPLDQEKILGYNLSFDPLPKVLKMTKIATLKDIGIEGEDDEKVKIPVSFSVSNHDGNVPDGCFDYNLKTRWSAQGGHEWLLMDFGEIISIEKMYLSFYCGDERATKFDIEVSNDGVNYMKVFEGTASGKTTLPQQFVFTGSGRYVRLNCYGNTNGNLWNSVQEIITITK